MLRRALLRALRAARPDAWPPAASASGAAPPPPPPPGAPRWAPAAAAAAALAAGLAAPAALAEAPATPPPPGHDSSWHLLGLDQRRRAFFTYEKRIREHSPPEKVFDYFASGGDINRGFVMTPADMMRSVVPVYPPRGSEVVRAGALPGEPAPRCPQPPSPFFAQFDIDGSGGIGFEEWLLFRSLLQVPPEDVEVAFMLVDTDSSGAVDRDEFNTLLEGIQARAARRRATGWRARGPEAAEPAAARAGLVAAFFGADGRREMSLAAFKNFVGALRAELARLEFLHYDFAGRGVITGRDFALSLICAARLKHVDAYLAAVDAMPAALAETRVSAAEYAAFRAVWRRLRRLETAIDFARASGGGGVSAEGFRRVAARVLGADIPPAMVEVIFYLFAGPDGVLNEDFLVGAMARHYESGLQVAGDGGGEGDGGGGGLSGAGGLFDCMKRCSAKGR